MHKLEEPRTWYVGEKVNKVRWYSKTAETSGVIAVGSYDDVINRVHLYHVDCDRETRLDPTPLCSVQTKGGVTDLRFVDVHGPKLLASTTSGCFYVFAIKDLDSYNFNPDSLIYPSLVSPLRWEKTPLHRGSMTGMDLWGQFELATVGEDGDVIIVDLLGSQPRSLSKGGDGAGHRAVRFISSTALLTASRDIKIWDLREQKMVKIVSDEAKGNVFIQSLSSHPDQPHIVAAGGSDGTLTMWDMRNPTWPLNKTTAHQDNIWEVQFHRSAPDHVITCSSTEVYLWNFNRSGKAVSHFGDLLKREVSSDSLTSVTTSQTTFAYNSFDIQDNLNALVCAGDGGHLNITYPLLPTSLTYNYSRRELISR